MDVIQSASDDQMALIGCAVALLLSGGLMYVSFFFGRGRQQAPKQPETLSFPEQQKQPSPTRKVA